MPFLLECLMCINILFCGCIPCCMPCCMNKSKKMFKNTSEMDEESKYIILNYDNNINLDFTYDPLCSICLVEYEHDDIIAILKCNHNYHKKCIKHYFETIDKNNLICPICRV